jgi:hypothetical protein
MLERRNCARESKYERHIRERGWMRLGPFIVGLLIGLVGGAGGMLYLVAQSKPADANEIAFSSKGFIDDDTYITVNGLPERETLVAATEATQAADTRRVVEVFEKTKRQMELDEALD